MEDTNSLILPYILETLSQKPELCDTYDNLCNELEEVLSSENFTGNITKAIRKALDAGQSLGIITFANEIIRVPFNFRTNAQNSRAPAILANDDQHFDDGDADSVCEYCHSPQRKTRRPRREVPYMLPRGHSKRRRSRSSGVRRRRSRRRSVRRRSKSTRR